jgi:putative chitinase
MNADQLRTFCPAAERFHGPLSSAVVNGDLCTPKRLSAFLAQVAHESAEFMRLVENLNYSAQGLANTWPRRYAVDPHARMREPNELARRLDRNPEAIANNVYASRLGNGDEHSGDGWRFRGRGLIQITGRANYLRYACTAFPRPEQLLDHPELLEQPLHAAQSAAWFWRAHGCNALADDGDFEGITRVINGGLNGLADRREWHAKAQRIFGGTS